MSETQVIGPNVEERRCHAPFDQCPGCDHYYGKAKVCKYAGEQIHVVVFEDSRNGRRYIYSRDAHAAVLGPDDDDKVIATATIILEPKGL